MEIRRITTSTELPIPLDELKLDLRIDDSDEDATLERNLLTAAAMIEVRSGAVIVPGTFEALFDACERIIVPRFPLREVTAIAAMTGANVWEDMEVADFRVLELAQDFELRPFPGFTAPTFYVPSLSVRVQFAAGYGSALSGESAGVSIELTDLYRGALTAITGSLFENRGLGEADAQFKTEGLMAGLLNAIRRFW